jgi:hypothetical protein
LRILLIPLGILAFLVFLLVVGAIALWLSLALISIIVWIVRLPVRLHGRIAGRRSRSQAL